MYVYLKATEDGNSLAVVSLNMDHNHPVSKVCNSCVLILKADFIGLASEKNLKTFLGVTSTPSPAKSPIRRANGKSF